MSQRNTAIPAVYLFLEKDNKYLVTRRCNTGYEDGNYQVPTGHVEDQELPTEAIIREAKEEIGVDLKAEDLEFVHLSYRPRHDETDNRVDIFFKASQWNGEIINAEPEKCDDMQWVDLDNLPKNMTAHVRKAFEGMQHGITFKEFDAGYLKSHGFYKL